MIVWVNWYYSGVDGWNYSHPGKPRETESESVSVASKRPATFLYRTKHDTETEEWRDLLLSFDNELNENWE